MKILSIFLIILIGTHAFALDAQNASENNQVLQSLACKVSLGFFKNSKVTDMQITILKGDSSTTLPSYPKAEVTFSLASQSSEKLPIATVGYVYAEPPFSLFSVVGYILSWNDNSKSELNLICQKNGTCSGSGVFQGNSQKVITCNDVTEK